MSVAMRGAMGRLLPIWRNYAIIPDDAIVKEVLDFEMAVSTGCHGTRKMSTFRKFMGGKVPCQG